MRLAAFGALAQGAFFAFLGGAPYIVTDVFNHPATVYGTFFTLLPLGALIGARLTARFGERLGNDRLMKIGAMISLAGAAAAVLLNVAGVWTPSALFAPVSIIALGNGLSLAGASAASVAAAGEHAGAGSSLFGFLQSVIGALIAQTVGAFQGDATPFPTIMIMAAVVFFAAVAAFAPGARARR
jgi:DHA1 family bicyclomycin/chloramphenicol resistance-like MFS transporter